MFVESLRAVVITAVIVVQSMLAQGAVPAAAHQRAVAANTQGWRYFKAGQLPRAAMRFRDALALDPDYVLAHYNLACVSSRLREAAVALDELRWLAASSDPLATAKLNKGLTDPDLDFVSVLPAVREVLQLPPTPATAATGAATATVTSAAAPLLAWLSERQGVWSAEQPSADCSERSYRFAFSSDGSLQLTVREACAGETVRTRVFDGSLMSDGGDMRVAVPSWAQWPDSVRLAFVACPGMGDAPASCFTLASDKSELGPFHRGLPGMSPMRARRDVANARP